MSEVKRGEPLILTIKLRDEYTDSAKRISRYSQEMKKSLKLDDLDSKKLREYGRALDSVQSKLSGIKSKKFDISVKTHVSALDKLTSKAKQIFADRRNLKAAKKEAKELERELRKTTGKKHKIRIGVNKSEVSQASSMFSALGRKAIKLGIGAAAVAGAKTLWDAGTELEKQKISMTHFLGGDRAKSDRYLSALRKEANATPFGTGEVIQAGTRAIQITDGDTKGALSLVRIAEDMAALTPGKTISDAMEALADMRMGEMERMKEFGFKGSKELFDAAGGDILKMKSATGKTLKELFEGGASKLSKSAGGKWSTVRGNIQSGIADAGLKFLDKLAPALSKLVPISEKIGAELPRAFDKLSPVLDIVGAVGKNVLIPAFTLVGGVTKNLLLPALNLVGNVAKVTVVPILNTLGGALNGVVGAVNWFGEVIGSVVDKISGAIGFLSGDKSSEYPGRKYVHNPRLRVGSNASGTLSWGGGLTRINELGSEIIDLPQGSRIYPADKSRQMMEREFSDGEKSITINNYNTFNTNTGGSIEEGLLAQLITKILLKLIREGAFNHA